MLEVKTTRSERISRLVTAAEKFHFLNIAHALAQGKTSIRRPLYSIILLCLLTVIAANNRSFSQTTESTEAAPKPIGTVNTPTSKVMNLPATNVELISTDGRKITVTVHKFEGNGINVHKADGTIHVIPLSKLSWESIAKLTGQELSYTKSGMDGFWLMGKVSCSRSR